jgi:hypothetical protein
MCNGVRWKEYPGSSGRNYLSCLAGRLRDSAIDGPWMKRIFPPFVRIGAASRGNAGYHGSNTESLISNASRDGFAKCSVFFGRACISRNRDCFSVGPVDASSKVI